MRAEERRLLLLILSVSLIGDAVYYYFNTGECKLVGKFLGYPLYWYFPTSTSVIFSLLLFTLAVLTFISIRTSEKVQKIVLIIDAIVLPLSILFFRLGYLDARPSKLMLELPYKTDSYVLEVYAAKMILEGKNPYLVDYKRILLHTVTPERLTYYYNNAPPYVPSRIAGFVHMFDYPPPAALWYVPALLLHIPPNVWDAIMLSLALLYVYYRGRRPLYFLLILTSSMFSYVSTAIMWNPIVGWLAPIIIAFVSENELISGILFSWAILYRPYCALLLPFYLIELYKNGKNIRKFLLTMIATSIIFLLPFITNNPLLILHRMFLPLFLNLNPYSSTFGLASIHFIGIDLPRSVFYALLGVTILIGVFLSYRYYDRLGILIYLFPTLSGFFYYRPSYVYYMYFPYIIALREYANSIRTIGDADPNYIGLTVLLAVFSLLLLFNYAFTLFAYRDPIFAILIVLLLISLPILPLFLKWVKYREITIYFLLISLIVSAVALDLVFRRVYFAIMTHNYVGDAWLLPILAAEKIIRLENPYYYKFNITSFNNLGALFMLIPYSKHIIDLSMIKVPKVVTYYLCFANRKHLCVVNFYDYPPMLALAFVPALLFHISPSYYSTFVFTMTLLALITYLIIRNRIDDLLLLILGAYVGYFLFIVFAFNSNSFFWVSMLVLFWLVVDRPLLAGLLLALAANTKPEPLLYIVFLLGLLYYYRGLNYAARLKLSYILTSLVIILPFLIPHPTLTLRRMFFPVFAKLEDSGISIIALIDHYLLHTAWCPRYMRSITVIVTLILLFLAYYYTDKLDIVTCLLPMIAILFFHRFTMSYIAYYIPITFIGYVTYIRHVEPLGKPLLKDLKHILDIIRSRLQNILNMLIIWRTRRLTY